MDDWTNLIDPKQSAADKTTSGNGAGDDGSVEIESGATSYLPAAPRPFALPATPVSTALQDEESLRLARRTSIRRAVFLIVLLVGLLWAIEGVDVLTPQVTSDVYGIQPRTAEGLRNIPFAPFLHAGFGHLSANTVPLLVLGLLVLLNGLQPFVIVSLVGTLVSGVGVWLLGGADTVHLGASGVIFGYLGFLLAAAWFQRSAGAIIVAVIAAFLYGGMLWGVLPGQEGVSWLGHLFGLAGGIVAAYMLRKKPKAPSAEKST